MKVGLQTPRKQQKLRKNILQNFISSRDEPVKSTKQCRDENVQEDYPTTDNGRREGQEDYPTSAAYTADIG